MTTRISMHTSDGCVGRCDARCHNATTPVCECICGGINHGVGSKQAAENTLKMAEEVAKIYAEQHGIEAYTLKIPDLQPSLPGL